MELINESKRVSVRIYPSLLTRMKSNAVDGIALLIGTFIIAALLKNVEGIADWLRDTLLFGLWGVYEPLCTALGGTLGNYVMNTRVRCRENEAKTINIFQAYVRFGTKLIFGWLCFVTMNTNDQKRAIHDFTAGSVVIENKWL